MNEKDPTLVHIAARTLRAFPGRPCRHANLRHSRPVRRSWRACYLVGGEGCRSHARTHHGSDVGRRKSGHTLVLGCRSGVEGLAVAVVGGDMNVVVGVAAVVVVVGRDLAWATVGLVAVRLRSGQSSEGARLVRGTFPGLLPLHS